MNVFFSAFFLTGHILGGLSNFINSSGFKAIHRTRSVDDFSIIGYAGAVGEPLDSEIHQPKNSALQLRNTATNMFLLKRCNTGSGAKSANAFFALWAIL